MSGAAGLAHCSRVRGVLRSPESSERVNGHDNPEIEMDEPSRHTVERCSHFNQERVMSLSLFICSSHIGSVCRVSNNTASLTIKCHFPKRLF